MQRDIKVTVTLTGTPEEFQTILMYLRDPDSMDQERFVREVRRLAMVEGSSSANHPYVQMVKRMQSAMANLR